MVLLRSDHRKVLQGTKTGSSMAMASCKNFPFGTFIFESVVLELKNELTAIYTGFLKFCGEVVSNRPLIQHYRFPFRTQHL